MKKSRIISAAIVFAAISFTACTSGKKEGEEKMEDKTPVAADSVSFDLSELIKSASQSCLAANELGKLAGLSATPEVRQAGEDFADLNAKLLDQIDSLATLKNIETSDSLDSKMAKRIDRTKKKQGAEFDEAVVRMMVSEQRRAANYIRRIGQVKDPDATKFARKNSKILLENAERIRNLRNKVSPGNDDDGDQPS